MNCEFSAKIHSRRSRIFPNIFTKIFINFAKRHLNNSEITDIVTKTGNLQISRKFEKHLNEWNDSLSRFCLFSESNCIQKDITQSIDSKFPRNFVIALAKTWTRVQSFKNIINKQKYRKCFSFLFNEFWIKYYKL